ncbi:MAG: heme o synthase, partial [Alicyclobacillus sp.]|nr:heme o synthase [Alicyclobacillus sp.]
LLLYTALAAMVVAQGGLPPWHLMVATLGGLGLAAGGSAAINMWYDRDIDGVMERTAQRPLPAGLVQPRAVLLFGLALGVAGSAWLASAVNGLAAALTATGYVYYAVVYTILLKRRTPQNIVIGGGAGAFPPLVGWVAVTGHLALPAWLMFAVIFLWTPSHFWGLALFRQTDYERASVPMLPVVRGVRHTIRQMSLYAGLLTVAALALTPAVQHRTAYLLLALLLHTAFAACHVCLWRSQADPRSWAQRTFFASLVYLPVLFAGLAVCAIGW